MDKIHVLHTWRYGFKSRQSHIRKCLFRIDKQTKNKKFLLRNLTNSKINIYNVAFKTKLKRKVCLNTGRFRGVFSKFKLTRYKLRELMLGGQINGFKKSNW